MPQYTHADLQIVDAASYIQSHVEQFFPGGLVTGSRLACGLVEDALLVGVQSVFTVHHDDCWAVIGSDDWLNTGLASGIPQLFSQITSFPEGGVNSMRSEVLLHPFCSDILVSTPETEYVVKGDGGPLRELVSPPFDWARAVAFRLPPRVN